MIPGLYLVALLVATGCMALLDHRFRLVLWRAPWRAVLTLGIGIGFFLAWDLAAIAAGHYGTGESPLLTGVMLAPELPLEELVFVTFLSYTTLVLWGLLALLSRRRSTQRSQHGQGPHRRPERREQQGRPPTAGEER